MSGYPIFTTAQVRTNLTKASGSDLAEVYFANWADVVIGIWGNLEILGDERRRERVGAERHGDPHDHERRCDGAKPRKRRLYQ